MAEYMACRRERKICTKFCFRNWRDDAAL